MMEEIFSQAPKRRETEGTLWEKAGWGRAIASCREERMIRWKGLKEEHQKDQ